MLALSMFIQIVGENESAEALDHQTRVLLDDFRQLEGVTATLPEESTPQGSYGDPITIGTIALSLVTGGVVTAIIRALSDWLKRGENRKVVLKVSVNGNTFETEFPSQGISQKELAELTEKIKRLLDSEHKHKG